MKKVSKSVLALTLTYFLSGGVPIKAYRVLDKVQQKYMTRNDCYTAGEKIKVTGIIIHSTAQPGIRAKDYYELWNKSYIAGEINREVCVHVFLDDKDIYQYLPWNHRGWHAGGLANNFCIGIEICEPKGIVYDSSGEIANGYNPKKFERYLKTVFNVSTDLCADLCERFHINPDNILCHCEAHQKGLASDHKDVIHWWKYHKLTMGDFRQEVKRKLKGRICKSPESTS